MPVPGGRLLARCPPQGQASPRAAARQQGCVWGSRSPVWGLTVRRALVAVEPGGTAAHSLPLASKGLGTGTEPELIHILDVLAFGCCPPRGCDNEDQI